MLLPVLEIDASEFHEFGFSRAPRYWHKVRACHELWHVTSYVLHTCRMHCVSGLYASSAVIVRLATAAFVRLHTFPCFTLSWWTSF